MLIHMPSKSQDYWGDGSWSYVRSAYDLISYRYIFAAQKDRPCAYCERPIVAGEPYLRCFAIEPCVDSVSGREVQAPKLIGFHVACGWFTYLNSDVCDYIHRVETGERRP